MRPPFTFSFALCLGSALAFFLCLLPFHLLFSSAYSFYLYNQPLPHSFCHMYFASLASAFLLCFTFCIDLCYDTAFAFYLCLLPLHFYLCLLPFPFVYCMYSISFFALCLSFTAFSLCFNTLLLPSHLHFCIFIQPLHSIFLSFFTVQLLFYIAFLLSIYIYKYNLFDFFCDFLASITLIIIQMKYTVNQIASVSKVLK